MYGIQVNGFTDGSVNYWPILGFANCPVKRGVLHPHPARYALYICYSYALM